MFRTLRRSFALFLVMTTIAGFFASPLFGALQLAFNYYDPFSISEYRLKRLTREEFVSEINAAVEADDYEDTQGLVLLAQAHGQTIPDEIVAKTSLGITENLWRYSRQFMDGIANGTTSSMASVSGAMASDFFVWGDIRDFTDQGEKAVLGQDYDKITLAMSALGIVATGQGPLDLGASLLKTAKKAKKIGKPMLDKLASLSFALIDQDQLKLAMKNLPKIEFNVPGYTLIKSTLQNVSFQDINKADFSKLRPLVDDVVKVDIGSARRSIAGVVRAAPVKELTEFAQSATSVAYKGGVKGAFRAIELSDTPRELTKFAKLSERYGYRTSPVLRMVGKGAIKLGKLTYNVVAALAFLIAWILGGMFWLFALAIKIRFLLR